MITTQLYGKNIFGSKLRADVPVSPITSADSVVLNDGTALSEKLKEIDLLKEELESLKRAIPKTRIKKE